VLAERANALTSALHLDFGIRCLHMYTAEGSRPLHLVVLDGNGNVLRDAWIKRFPLTLRAS
jgi:hypothetical protein